MTDHDHAVDTHSAKCDAADCTYVAVTHAHDEDAAVAALSDDLAAHNKSVHNLETNAQEIHDAVRAKMQSL